MTDSASLFQALELAHYAERFRGALFLLALENPQDLENMRLDITVLGAYRIRMAATVAASTDQPILNQPHFYPPAPHWQQYLAADTPKACASQVQATLQTGRIPVLFISPTPCSTATIEPSPALKLAAQLAPLLQARKLFLFHPAAKQLENITKYNQITPAQLREAQTKYPSPVAALLEISQAVLNAGVPDVVLLPPCSGLLFEEVFTYEGAGVLLSQPRDVQIRQACFADIPTIQLLLKPETVAAKLLPLDENQLNIQLEHQFVYTVDGLIVAAARLQPWDTAAELASFCTLPRYRGQGRARELAKYLLEQARKEGFRSAFALSTDSRMGEFFLQLGLKEVEKHTLPAAWQASYDSQRSSRAFCIRLSQA